MTKPEPSSINAHEDVALFREAVRFTAAESGFVPRLIEKDYLYLFTALVGIGD